MDAHDRQQKSRRVINVGLVANIFLAVIKTATGIFGHSPALLADGINSTSDVVYYVMVKVFVALAGKPADEEHPYGHRQFETIGALVVGVFIVTTSVAVFWTSVDTVVDLLSGRRSFAGASVAAFWIAAATIALKIVLALYTGGAGRKTNNLAIRALARDHVNDILSATAAAAGIALGRAGYGWVDPLAGAVVALIIFRTGIGIMWGSSHDLMDSVPGAALAKRITGLLQGIPEIKKIDEIYAHRFGPYLVINLTISLEGSLSVSTGDRIATDVEQRIYEAVDSVRRVHVHYHPLKERGPSAEGTRITSS